MRATTVPSKKNAPPAGSGDDGGPGRREVAVHVAFAPSCGPALRNRNGGAPQAGERSVWAERPLLLERRDGSYDLIGVARQLRPLARWVLQFGGKAVVQGPEALREAVVREAQNAWVQHTHLHPPKRPDALEGPPTEYRPADKPAGAG